MRTTPSSTTTITTLLLDVDDTLYDVGTGLTAHRNGEGAQSFMVAKLGFPNPEAASMVLDPYFERYHATTKALTVAQDEGELPEGINFQPHDLAEWWATHLDFSMLGGTNTGLVQDLTDCPLRLVAFSNGPRKYVIRVLKELGVWELFGEDGLFAVEDVMPHCKPEREAFWQVLDKIGAQPEQCVMIEDSMKNIQKAKELGMKTVLISGIKHERDKYTEDAETKEPGNFPWEDDPAVDIAVESINHLKRALPGLWQTPAVFY